MIPARSRGTGPPFRAGARTGVGAAFSLRRALLRRAVLSGWAAWARGDLDLMLVRWAPDCQLELLPELMAAGMRGIYHGHAGVRELAADWTDTWERMDLIPEEIVDARNPVIGLGHLRLRGRGSGVEFNSPIAFVWSFERGLVVRQRDFADWDEALRGAGIPTASAGEPQRATPI